MKVVKKGRYILHAPWHSHNGKEVEVIMKRKGLSPSYKDKQIFHLAFDPDDDFRSEDLDTEFIEENFRSLDAMMCVLDTTMAGTEIIEKFKPHYNLLKRKMLERLNIEFFERTSGNVEPPGDYLCTFYLVSDAHGNPGLTLDKSGNGEILIVEKESEEEVIAKKEKPERKKYKS